MILGERESSAGMYLCKNARHWAFDGTDGTFYPELGAEWERVNLALCRAIYAGAYGPTAQPIAAVSTLLQVNGDGRPYAERGPTMPFEPDAHGTTCTIGADGTFSPVEFYNRLPDYE